MTTYKRIQTACDCETVERILTLYVRYYNSSIDRPTNGNVNIHALKRIIGEELGKLNSMSHENLASTLQVEFSIHDIEYLYDKFGVIVLRTPDNDTHIYPTLTSNPMIVGMSGIDKGINEYLKTINPK